MYQNDNFRALKIAKMAFLELWHSLELISRKIWVTGKCWIFHTVYQFHEIFFLTHVLSGEHLEQLRLRAGFCLEPWHLIANLQNKRISCLFTIWIKNPLTVIPLPFRNIDFVDQFVNFFVNSNKILRLLQLLPLIDLPIGPQKRHQYFWHSKD